MHKRLKPHFIWKTTHTSSPTHPLKRARTNICYNFFLKLEELMDLNPSHIRYAGVIWFVSHVLYLILVRFIQQKKNPCCISKFTMKNM